MHVHILRIVALVALFSCSHVLFGSDGNDLSIGAPVLEVRADGTWDFTTNGQLTGKALGNAIESEIGAGNYQLVSVVLATCSSGAGLGPVTGQLSGPHNAIAACGASQSMALTVDKQGHVGGFVPAFFDSINADPSKSVDAHLTSGKLAEERFPKTPADENAAKQKYERYRQAVIARNAKRQTANPPEAPFTVPPPWEQGGRDSHIQEPQNDQSADKPGTKKIASGASNHAIIFRADDRASASELEKKARDALTKAGFNSISTLTPFSQVDQAELTKAKAENRVPNLRPDLATEANLRKKLADLKASMNASEQLTVVVIAHGSVQEQSSSTQTHAGVGNGAVFSPGAAMDFFAGGATASLLAEEARSLDGSLLYDDYMYSRWSQPALVFQTAAENDPSGLPVGAMINGIDIGAFDLASGYTPDLLGFHYLTISDYAIEQIIDQTDFTGGLTVSFEFGGPDDAFRLATADDLVSFGGAGFYGMQLLFNLDGDNALVPMPPTLILIGTAYLILWWVLSGERRQSHGGSGPWSRHASGAVF